MYSRCKPDNTVAIKPVTVGRVFGDKIVIESGVAPGDTVVTDGTLILFPGATVKLVDPSKVGAGGVMNLSRIFIERPVMTALVSFAILLFGIVGFRGLPVAALPSVDYPTIQVTRSPSGRESGDHGLERGHAARARSSPPSPASNR